MNISRFLFGFCLVLVAMNTYCQTDSLYFRIVEMDAYYNFSGRYPIDKQTAMRSDCYLIEYNEQNKPVNIEFLKAGRFLRVCHPEYLRIQIKYEDNRKHYLVVNKDSEFKDKSVSRYVNLPTTTVTIEDYPSENKKYVLFSTPVKKTKYEKKHSGLEFEYSEDGKTYSIYPINKRKRRVRSKNKTLQTYIVEDSIFEKPSKAYIFTGFSKNIDKDSAFSLLYTYTYDQYGNESEIRFFIGKVHNRKKNELYEWGEKNIYNHKAQILEYYYFCPHTNNPMTDTTGVHKYLLTYNDKGFMIEVIHIGTGGNKVENDDGVAIYRFKLDEFGNIIESTSYGTDNQIKNDKHNVARQVSIFDDCGNLIEFRLYNAAGVLYEGTQYWAAGRYKYDEKGNVIEEKYYDNISFHNQNITYIDGQVLRNDDFQISSVLQRVKNFPAAKYILPLL